MNAQDQLPIFGADSPAQVHTFQDQSYRHHTEHWEKLSASDEWRRISRTWFDESTADYWRHQRMYEAVSHLADWKGERWLTIGDGQFGLDSVRLQRRGVKTAIPTDISGVLLREAKQQGIIRDYSVENAEKLRFLEESFDFVFCKEAYHHFPRPLLALYEMLRVSKTGVILVEPQDQERSFLQNALYMLRRAARRQKHFDERRYEESGNYVYSISRRGLAKVSLGWKLPGLAFKGISDFYLSGLEFSPASYSSPKFLVMRAANLTNRILTAFRLSLHNVLMCCIFKVDPPRHLKARLRQNRWEVVDLPRNPYAQERATTSDPQVVK